MFLLILTFLWYSAAAVNAVEYRKALKEMGALGRNG